MFETWHLIVWSLVAVGIVWFGIHVGRWCNQPTPPPWEQYRR